MTVIIRDSDYKPAEIPEEDKAPSAVVDPNVHAGVCNVQTFFSTSV